MTAVRPGARLGRKEWQVWVHNAPMPQDEERPTPADLAARIAEGDRPSTPQPERLRLQWNVPRGVQPHIPLWFSLLVLGLFAVMVLNGMLNR